MKSSPNAWNNFGQPAMPPNRASADSQDPASTRSAARTRIARLTAIFVPIAFSGAVLLTALPEAIDVYSSQRPGQDFFYFLDAGRLVTSDRKESLYDPGMDEQRWLADEGYRFPGSYPYPPLVALLTAPLSRLSVQAAFDVWKLAVIMSAILVAGVSAAAFKSWAWRVAVVLSLFCWQPLLLNIRFGQTGAFFAAIAAAGFLIFMSDQRRGAGVLGLLSLKPTAALSGLIAVFPQSVASWLRFAAVGAVAVVLPFLWLGPGALPDWLDILTNRSVQDLSGGHPYNQGLSRLFGLDYFATYLLIAAGLVAVVYAGQVVLDRLGMEAAIAFAIYCALLLNPHSLLYDWVAAFVGLFFMRRSSALHPLATDFGAGLLAMSLYAAGQLSWSETLRETWFRPLTLWAALVVVVILGRMLVAEYKLRWRRQLSGLAVRRGD